MENTPIKILWGVNLQSPSGRRKYTAWSLSLAYKYCLPLRVSQFFNEKKYAIFLITLLKYTSEEVTILLLQTTTILIKCNYFCWILSKILI